LEESWPGDWDASVLDPAQCRVFGASPGGDMLVFTPDGNCGFASHETQRLQPLGTIEMAIDWVFEKLLASDWPEYDYSADH
jgi:hypothetical protein